MEITAAWFDGDVPNPLHPVGWLIDPVRREVTVPVYFDGRPSALLSGVLTGVIYPRPEEHEWASLPRGRLRARRDAASKEVFERAYREWKSKQPTPEAVVATTLAPGASLEDRIAHALGGEGMKRMGFALSYPLRQNLDYAGIGRRLFFTGERTENYERASPGQPWKRRPDRRLF